MKKYGWVFSFLVLLLGILACAGGFDVEDAPQLAGTVTYEETEQVDAAAAKAALQIYGRDVLGIDLPNIRAGGKAGELNLPVSTMDGVEVAFDLAGTTYFGVWGQGAASLSFGDTAVSGDLYADVQDGTLGAFAIRVSQPLPVDAPTALGLILTTYPGLLPYEFFETPIEETGFQFTSGQAENVAVSGWNVTLTGTTISAGVRPGMLDGNSLVWVVVASGDLAAPFNQ